MTQREELLFPRSTRSAKYSTWLKLRKCREQQFRIFSLPRFIFLFVDKREEKRAQQEFVCVLEGEDSSSGEMGNSGSFTWQSKGSKKEQDRKPDVPDITVIEASPLPVEGVVFNLPEPERTVQLINTGLSPGVRHAETSVHISSSSQHFQSTHQESDNGEDESHLDTQSLSESEDRSTPKSSRRLFIETMISSSPQVRHSVALHDSFRLSSRSNSDSLSMISANMEDDRMSVTLDPLEHEWMMCASDAEWDSLRRLLLTEPGLVLKKDFVTGFTCLHWAAKHNKPELIVQILDFAKQHDVPASVDVRSNVGYTPLHIAAMHNHMEVIKILLGAFNADVEIRDYSGRKACQYLSGSVGVDIQDIIGAYEHSEPKKPRRRARWSFSKVLQSNFRSLRGDCDSPDGEGRPREKPVRRSSSISRMMPKLQRLRLRTSQIVHSTSFYDRDDTEGSKMDSVKTRPKTHFFG